MRIYEEELVQSQDAVDRQKDRKLQGKSKGSTSAYIGRRLT